MCRGYLCSMVITYIAPAQFCQKHILQFDIWPEKLSLVGNEVWSGNTSLGQFFQGNAFLEKHSIQLNMWVNEFQSRKILSRATS